MASAGFDKNLKQSEFTIGDLIGKGSTGTEAKFNIFQGSFIKVPGFLLLSKIQHPNVINYYGASTDVKGKLIVVQELLFASVDSILFSGTNKRDLSFFQRLSMAIDAARGIQWLHSCKPAIIHGDLNLQNLLVTTDLKVKVADFGQSLLKTTQSSKLGTIVYNAPERLRDLVVSIETDVYSLGICFYEIAAVEKAFGQYKPAERSNLITNILAGERPFHKPHFSESLKTFLNSCWSPDPTQRPPSNELSSQGINIQIDCAIPDLLARKFWASLFVDDPKLEIGWNSFKVMICDRLDCAGDFEHETWLQTAFATTNPRLHLESDIEIVTVETFGLVTGCFGPFNESFLATLESNLSQPWFHGHCDARTATQRLRDLGKREGCFLVRYSATSVGFSVSRTHNGKVLHHRMIINDGKYSFADDPGKTFPTVIAALSMLKVQKACPGSPYEEVRQRIERGQGSNESDTGGNYAPLSMSVEEGDEKKVKKKKAGLPKSLEVVSQKTLRKSMKKLVALPIEALSELRGRKADIDCHRFLISQLEESNLHAGACLMNLLLDNPDNVDGFYATDSHGPLLTLLRKRPSEQLPIVVGAFLASDPASHLEQILKAGFSEEKLSLCLNQITTDSPLVIQFAQLLAAILQQPIFQTSWKDKIFELGGMTLILAAATKGKLHIHRELHARLDNLPDDALLYTGPLSEVWKVPAERISQPTNIATAGRTPSSLDLRGRRLKTENESGSASAEPENYVAVKRFFTDDFSWPDLWKEIVLLSLLQSDKTVRFEGACTDPRSPYLIMELLEGHTLKDWITTNPSATSREEACYMAAEAVQFVHNKGVLHRDLKVENFMFDRRGKLKLLDFGISRSVTKESTRMTMIGTPDYMAPEVLTSQPYSFPADIYSLAIVFWRILSGRERPFESANPFRLADSISQENLRPSLKDVPKTYWTILEAAWHDDPSARPTIDALLGMLPRGKAASSRRLLTKADSARFEKGEEDYRKSDKKKPEKISKGSSSKDKESKSSKEKEHKSETKSSKDKESKESKSSKDSSEHSSKSSREHHSRDTEAKSPKEGRSLSSSKDLRDHKRPRSKKGEVVNKT